MKKVGTIKKALFALIFFIVVLSSVTGGLVGLFSRSQNFSDPVSDDQPFVSSSDVLNSDSETASEQRESSSPSDRSFGFSSSAFSNPIISSEENLNPIIDPDSIDNQPLPIESSPEFVPVIAERKERLVEEIDRVFEELPPPASAPAQNFILDATPPSQVGPTVSGPVRHDNSLPDHADSTEMAIGERFKEEEGYSTLNFNNATAIHEYDIVTTERQRECTDWDVGLIWSTCMERAPERDVVVRQTERHRKPVIVKDGNPDYAVFLSQDEENRLHLRLYSNFKEWKRWALASRARQWAWRDVPLLRLMDEITFEANENSEEEIMEWIKSRLDRDSELPDWSLTSRESKLLYIFRGLWDKHFLTLIQDSRDTAVEWRLVVFQNEGDIRFYITINNEGRLLVKKGTAAGETMLEIPIDGLDLDVIIEYLSALILFHNRPANDFEILNNYLNSHAIRSEGFRTQDISENQIRLVRFDSNQSILISKEAGNNDIFVDAQIPDTTETDSETVINFNDLDFQIPMRAISDSEEPEALLNSYLDIFKRILSVNILLPEANRDNPEWISLFELLSAFFGERILTEKVSGDDPDPRYIGSYFQLVNTEEGTDNRLEFWINFLRVSRRESASDTTKKILLFFRSFLEDTERAEEILSLAELINPDDRYRLLIETVNALLLDGIEGTSFDLKSRKRIESCSIAFDINCYTFVFQLLDNFRINDLSLFFVRFIKIFFYEIREHGPSNLDSIDPSTTSLDFDVVSRIFAPENAERNMITMKSLLKEVISGIEIFDEDGQKINLLDMVFNSIAGHFARFFKYMFDAKWKASTDDLVESKREEILNFLGKIPKSFRIVDDLRSMFDSSNDFESRRDNLAEIIGEQTSGVVSGRLAKLVAITILSASRSESDLPENADPVSETTEDDPELIADLETILNLEGARFFSSLDNDNQNEFSWSGAKLDRGIKLREYLKNRTAERRNILVFNWTNSEKRSFTTAIRVGEVGPEVIFHFEGASPRTIDRLNSLISSRIAVPSVT